MKETPLDTYNDSKYINNINKQDKGPIHILEKVREQIETLFHLPLGCASHYEKDFNTDL